MEKRKRMTETRHNLFILSLIIMLGCETAPLIKRYGRQNNIYHNNELIIDEDEQKELEEMINKEISADITDKENSLVLSAVMKNDNLSNIEKEIMYGFVDLLEDNPYLDKENAYRNLKTVNIVYDPNGDYGEDVIGLYSGYKNEIVIIKDYSSRTTMLHEIVHCIHTNSLYTKRLPEFITEGMTELLTDEYFSTSPFIEQKSYSHEIVMVKMLTDIVGPDKMLETYSKQDLNILKEALKEEMNLSEPSEFIDTISYITDSIRDKKELDDEKVDSVIGALTNYYNDNYEIDSIEYEMYLYNKNLLETIKEDYNYRHYQDYLIDNGYYTKAYFSKKLKNEYQEIQHVNYGEEILNDTIKEYTK